MKLRNELKVQVDDEREPNAETLIEVLDADDRVVHTLLRPHSGKMHQLRVHLAALGLGILNDPFYPELRGETARRLRPPHAAARARAALRRSAERRAEGVLHDAHAAGGARPSGP